MSEQAKPPWEQTIDLLRSLEKESKKRAGEDQILIQHFVHAFLFHTEALRKSRALFDATTEGAGKEALKTIIVELLQSNLALTKAAAQISLTSKQEFIAACQLVQAELHSFEMQ